MASSDTDVATIAARQLGLITTSQALDAGLNRSAVRRRVVAGRWTALGRGVFAIAGAPRSWRQRVLAACLATEGVASHQTAARLHRLGHVPTDGAIHVTVDARRSARSPLAHVHRTRETSLLDTSIVDDVPTTGIARTLFDLAPAVGEARLARIVDDALDRGVVDLGEMVELLDRSRGQRRAGIGRLARVLGERGDGRLATESVFERRFLSFCVERRLPLPETQVVLADSGGPIARCDALFRDARLIVELDGRRGHSQLTARADDAVRDQRLMAIGWRTARVTWSQLTGHPDALADRLAAMVNGLHDRPPV